MSYFQVTFSEKLLFDSSAYNTDNYVITPTLTISSIERVDDYTVKVNVTSFEYDTDYTVQVYNVRNIYGTEVFGVSPSIALVPTPFVILSASAVNSTTLAIEFGGDILNSGAVLNPVNYTITGPTTPSVSLVTYIDPNNVTLTIEEMRNLGSYMVTVSNVLSNRGTALTVDATSFTGIGIAPRVSSATSTNASTVRVVFNEPMSDTGLTTNGNYAFTCPVGATITVGGVAKINSTTVDITTVGEMRTGTNNYTVTVSNVTDSAGNVIDPLYDNDTFNGIGVAPQVSGAAYVAIRTCTVTFNENMDTTSAETPGNYAVSGPTSPNVSTAVLAGAVVTLTFDADMIDGDYTITVSNVTDVAGNVIDPAHDDGTYTATVAIPLILFGGDDGTYDNETWKWNGTDWTQLTPAHSPPARRYHAACYDSARKVIIVFGGYIGGGGTNRANDTWEWNGIDWTQVSTAHSPTTRSDMALAYDANRGVTVLFGGYNGTVVNDETWEYNGVDWVQKFPAAKPSARCSYGMGYDPVYQKVLLLGGTNWISGSGQFWEYDGTNWTLKAANPLGTQQGMTFTYDTNRNITLFTHCWAISMGWNTYEYNYATNTWATYAPVPKPSKRYLAGFAYSPDELASILFGGYDGALDDETWSWNGTAWTQKLPAHSPSARYGHSLTAYGS